MTHSNSKLGKLNNHFKHGLSKTRFYQLWIRIRWRTENVNADVFHHYGGRGIKLSISWHKFENFRDDMYESYLEHRKKFGNKNTTIDRIDNDGAYCKENCRWATIKEQAVNKRNTVYVFFNGQRHNLCEWEKITGISYQNLYNRLFAYKWPIEKALTEKLRYT